MNEFREANEKLIKIAADIGKATFEVNLARDKFLEAEAVHERKFAQTILEEKAKNKKKTQTDLKSKAIVATEDSRMELVRSESRYRALQEDVKSLYAQLDALREMCFNLRKEAGLGGAQ